MQFTGKSHDKTQLQMTQKLGTKIKFPELFEERQNGGGGRYNSGG